MNYISVFQGGWKRSKPQSEGGSTFLVIPKNVKGIFIKPSVSHFVSKIFWGSKSCYTVLYTVNEKLLKLWEAGVNINNLEPWWIIVIQVKNGRKYSYFHRHTCYRIATKCICCQGCQIIYMNAWINIDISKAITIMRNG